MEQSLIAQIEQLRELKASALRRRYREVFGEESHSANRQFLFRRIAWRLQVNAEGDLSDRARRRALEIADDSDLRIRAPKSFALSSLAASVSVSRRDVRLPIPGSVLTRQHGDKRVVVTVLEDGFEYEGRRYRSLSAVASKVTGTRWNGLLFFGIAGRAKGTRG